MTLSISPSDHISDVQNAFAAAYPHLKLQFFSKAHGESKGSFAKFLIHDRSTLLGTLNPALQAGELRIAPDTVTWHWKKNLKKTFTCMYRCFGNRAPFGWKLR